MAGSQPEMHRGGVSGDQSQAAPTRHESVMLGALDQPIVELRDRRQRQLGSRQREGLLGHVTHKLCLLLQVAEETVQFGLDALAHA